MADIDVERKGPSIWPWIIGLIVLALLIWALASLFGEDEPEVAGTDPLVAPVVTDPAAPAPVVPAPAAGAQVAGLDEYMSTCADAPPPEMGVQHQYTGDCIRQLATALSSVVERDTVGNTAIQPMLQDFRRKADAIQESDWQSTQHANRVREVFTSAASLMETVQQQRYGTVNALGTEVSQARQAAQSVQPTTSLLDQSDTVRTFFQEAGQALRIMADQPATGV
jgi:hypothetical protein